MVAILATVNEADNVTLVRAEGGVLPVFPLPITAAGVVSVGAAAPITSTGGPTPVIGITPATELAAGSMSAADKTKLDNLSPSEVQSVAVVSPITLAGTAANPIVGFAGTDINASGQVDAISGPSPIPIAPATLAWTAATASPGIVQTQQANGSAPQPMQLIPQPPGAAATNATNGTPGSLVIGLAAPVNGGAEAFFQLNRSGGLSTYVGAYPALATTASAVWLGLSTAPTNSNYNLLSIPGGGEFDINVPLAGQASFFQVVTQSPGFVPVFFTGQSTTALGRGTCISGAAKNFGGGVGVALVTNATTEPTVNSTAPAGTTVWAFTNGALKCRGTNGWRANLVAIGSAPANVNTQLPNVDTFSTVVRTVSTATPTAFADAYTTASGTIGWINVRLKSKAATTAGGITTGDGAFADYRLGYKNVAGTVTLSTAGLTLLGAVQTTNALLTSVLTAAAAGATVVFSVTNVAGNTVDSLIDCTIDVC
jgi:hypothetical protein